MIDYIYDTFKLYLAKNYQYVKRYDVGSREHAYQILDTVKDDYNEYMIVGHINILNEDDILEHNWIEHSENKTRKRER